ncbi:MAG: rod shape-determining protein MreC [bacterium]|nr:rod shape-determining protein MreC [bacterium]
MLRRYFIILIVILLAGTIYFTAFFIKKERSFGENLRFRQENEELKAQIQLSKINSQKSIVNNNFLTAKVFSTYPFNIKNQITVNAGEKQGIKKLSAAILKENILIGQVNEVFENYSVVKTIFDSNFQLPVRIGKDEINALFQGGAEPKVILIDKEKPLQIGDVVYSASSEFPYGLKIGEISEIKETSAGVFKEAILKMPFNVNELREVNIKL